MIPMDRKSPIDPHIGQRLKEYRQHRGMTVRELAEAAHVTPGQISRYEHGRDRISHERVTEFARILRIKTNDLYQPPGSRLRRNHVRWRLTNFMAAVIAEAAALMSSRKKAAADNEATMVAAVAVAVGVSAAAASDAGAGEKSSLTTSADDTAVDISDSLSGAALKFNPIWHRMAGTVADKERIISVEGKLEKISDAVSETIFRADAETTLQLDASDAPNALLIMDGANTDTINLPGHYTINAAESQGRGGKVAHDPPMSAAGEPASVQSTSTENGFIVSNTFPFTKTASGNKDHSVFQFKPSMDHHAVTDPESNDITKEHPKHPAHPHSDNFKFADSDDHPGKASHDD
jgi:transcriptional regulator with XRE-family HTH domain